MRMLKLLIAVGSFLTASSVFSASFDCQKASMPIEKAICANPALSSLDEQMAETYSKVKANSADTDKLKQEQVGWIREVRSCADDACIHAQYTNRIAALKSSIEQPTVTTPTEQTTTTDAKPQPEEAASSASSENAVASAETQSVKTENTEPRPDPTIIEIGFGYGVGLLILFICFVIYNKFPKLRFLTIATPFDIGAKFERTEAYEAVKKRRQWSEFWMFLVTLVIYWISITSTFSGSSNIPEAMFNPIIAFIIPYGIYVLWHGIKGSSSKCPKCKNSYAKNCTNSYREPKATWEKRTNAGMTNRPLAENVKVMESGINHADYECIVCHHSWHEATSYEREISHYTS